MIENKTNAIIIILGALALGMFIYILITALNNYSTQEEISLNQTIQNATIQSYQQGVYDVINTQTKTGNIYYLDNSTGNQTLKTISIKELCGIK
jgi:cell division protein FtsL